MCTAFNEIVFIQNNKVLFHNFYHFLEALLWGFLICYNLQSIPPVCGTIRAGTFGFSILTQEVGELDELESVIAYTLQKENSDIRFKN